MKLQFTDPIVILPLGSFIQDSTSLPFVLSGANPAFTSRGAGKKQRCGRSFLARSTLRQAQGERGVYTDVTPAKKAGVQSLACDVSKKALDSRFRENDGVYGIVTMQLFDIVNFKELFLESEASRHERGNSERYRHFQDRVVLNATPFKTTIGFLGV